MKPFIFVHINKTGGTSIKSAFKIQPYDKFLKLNTVHKCASEYIKTLGRPKWDGLFSFTVVRNPWDRFVSGWKYLPNYKNLTVNEVLDNIPMNSFAYRHLIRPQLGRMS